MSVAPRNSGMNHGSGTNRSAPLLTREVGTIRLHPVPTRHCQRGSNPGSSTWKAEATQRLYWSALLSGSTYIIPSAEQANFPRTTTADKKDEKPIISFIPTIAQTVKSQASFLCNGITNQKNALESPVAPNSQRFLQSNKESNAVRNNLSSRNRLRNNRYKAWLQSYRVTPTQRKIMFDNNRLCYDWAKGVIMLPVGTSTSWWQQ